MPTLQLGPVRVDLETGALEGRPDPGGPGRLSPTERKLLIFLRERAGQTVSRATLLQEVWGYAPGVVSRTADTTFARLRKKIELDPANPRFLLTIHGEGYRMELPDAAPAPQPSGTARWQVAPMAADPLLGRVREQALLKRWMDHGRWLTIHGPGGVGKTRLARALAEAAADHPRFGDGVAWVSLAPLRRPEQVAPEIARVLSVPIRGDRPINLQLYAALAERRLLLVLDNAEHVLSGVAALEDVVEGCPGLVLAVTSRVLVETLLEQRLPLKGLAEDCLPLFVARARRHRPDFSPTPSQEEAILSRCRQVGGLPLAVEMMAAAFALTGRLGALRDGDHHSMQAVFEGSLRLLPPDAAAALLRLSVIRAAFSEEAAGAVAGCTPAHLDSLYQAALIQPHGSRWLVHPLIRRLASERLAQSGALIEARGAHRRWFLDRLCAMAPALMTARQPGVITTLLPEAADLVEAMQAACGGAIPWLTPAEAGAFGRWVLCRAEGDGLDVLLSVYGARLAASGPEAAAVLQAWQLELYRATGRDRTLAIAGLFALTAGDVLARVPPDERVWALQYVRLYDPDLSPVQRLTALAEGPLPEAPERELSRAVLVTRQLRRMQDDAGLLAATARWKTLLTQTPNLWRACQTFQLASEAALSSGRLAEAREHIDAAWRRARTLDNPLAQVVCLISLSTAARYQGSHDEMEQRAREGIALAESIGVAGMTTPLLYNLGLACRNQGRLSEARECFVKSERIAAREQQSEQRLLAHLAQGGLLLRSGRTDAAVAWFEAALPDVLAQGLSSVTLVARANLAESLSMAGRYEDAVAQFTALLPLSAATSPVREAQHRVSRAYSLVCLERTDEAGPDLVAALSLMLSAGERNLLYYALIVWAQALIAEQQPDAAAVLLATIQEGCPYPSVLEQVRSTLDVLLPPPLPLDVPALSLALRDAGWGAASVLSR